MNFFVAGFLAGVLTGGGTMAYLNHGLHVDIVAQAAKVIDALRAELEKAKAEIAALKAKL